MEPSYTDIETGIAQGGWKGVRAVPLWDDVFTARICAYVGDRISWPSGRHHPMSEEIGHVAHRPNYKTSARDRPVWMNRAAGAPPCHVSNRGLNVDGP